MGIIYKKLKDYSDSDYYGFHMPGHKRNDLIMGQAENRIPYSVDITEIDGFDDLHHADGILRDAQERAARVYSAGETHFLVNGSTAGILSAILGTTKKGDTILVARNCHKSVYHAIYMNGLKPVYLYPGFDENYQLNTGICAGEVREALEKYPMVRAVIIVSPTYDGVVSDVKALADTVHEKGIPLIVDEAHGAHFGFHPYFPENSNSCGADIVIHSIHKTLPSLTQTALLHMNGRIVNRQRVRKYLHMLQTSSPSYVLMASIDSCVDLLDRRGEEIFASYTEKLSKAREELRDLKHLRLAVYEEETDYRAFDRSKIILSTKGTDITGRELYVYLLEQYHLQMEMMAGDYVLAMTSVGDTQEGFDRLVSSVKEIDKKVCCGKKKKPAGKILKIPQVYTSAEVEKAMEERGDCSSIVRWESSAGYIALEYAYLYPPGIPIIVPGERITEEAVRQLLAYTECGYSVEGLKRQGQIEVWINGTDILYNGKELFGEGYHI